MLSVNGSMSPHLSLPFMSLCTLVLMTKAQSWGTQCAGLVFGKYRQNNLELEGFTRVPHRPLPSDAKLQRKVSCWIWILIGVVIFFLYN